MSHNTPCWHDLTPSSYSLPKAPPLRAVSVVEIHAVRHTVASLLLLAHCALWLRRYVYSIRNRMYDSLAPYIKESDKEKLSATLQVRARGRGGRGCYVVQQ